METAIPDPDPLTVVAIRGSGQADDLHSPAARSTVPIAHNAIFTQVSEVRLSVDARRRHRGCSPLGGGAAEPRGGGITPRVGVADVQVRAEPGRRGSSQERMGGRHVGDSRLARDEFGAVLRRDIGLQHRGSVLE